MREPAAPLRETPAPAVRASWTDWYGARVWLRTFAIAAAASVFMAYIGAFDASPSFPQRLLFWVPTMFTAAIAGGFVVMLVGNLRGVRRNPWIFWAAATLACTPPITLIVWAYWSWLFIGRFRLAELSNFAPGVFVVSAVMTGIMIAVSRPGAVTHAAGPDTPPTPVRFLERLPPRLRGAELFAVSAEDHYLRLHTSKGDDLILFRLSDAIAELDGLEGAQVHRSWWVARDGLAEVARENGRVSLKLKSGALAPVSRPNVRALRDAGWF